jgi:hypothetical protein
LALFLCLFPVEIFTPLRAKKKEEERVRGLAPHPLPLIPEAAAPQMGKGAANEEEQLHLLRMPVSFKVYFLRKRALSQETMWRTRPHLTESSSYFLYQNFET